MKPSSFLFPHTIDHYTVSYAKDTSGAKTPTYTVSTTGIKSFVQPAVSEIKAEYQQTNEVVTTVCYIQNLTYYDAIGKSDRIVYDSTNFVVKGKKNPCELNRVGRIDLEVEAD